MRDSMICQGFHHNWALSQALVLYGGEVCHRVLSRLLLCIVVFKLLYYYGFLSFHYNIENLNTLPVSVNILMSIAVLMKMMPWLAWKYSNFSTIIHLPFGKESKIFDLETEGCLYLCNMK